MIILFLKITLIVKGNPVNILMDYAINIFIYKDSIYPKPSSFSFQTKRKETNQTLLDYGSN